jgi:hypothetical protein
MIAPKYTTIAPRILLLLALALSLVWLGQIGWHGIQLWQLASQAEQFAQEGVGELEFEQAQDIVHRAAYQLTGLDADLRLAYPVLRLASGLPWMGKAAGQVQPLVQYAAGLAQAGDLVLTALAPIGSQEAAGTAPERLYAALVAGRAQFAAADQALDRAGQARQGIEPALLPERLGTLITRLDEKWPLLKAGVAMLSYAPELMGGSQPAIYLLLAQNQKELRATGGFITAIGNLRLERGRVLDFQIADSFIVEDFSKPYPQPPEPLQRYMLAGYWVPRDANWSPDYPIAARQVQSLVELSTGVPTQGVIAFDQTAVARLLSVTGPLSLPNVPEAVSEVNVEIYMQQAWEPAPGKDMGGEEWLRRKDFMRVLGKALLEKLFQSSQPATLIDLGRTALELVETGHLLVYLNQPEAQALLEGAGLAHQLVPGYGDSLMLVDSNVGFNKADGLVQRSLEYRVDLSDPDRPVAQLTVHYVHKGDAQVACVHQAVYDTNTYAELSQRCYWDYWRVYVPMGSTLLESQVKSVPGEQLLARQPWPGVVEVYPGEGGMQVFAGMLVLPTRQQESISLTYSLPAGVIAVTEVGSLRYTLRLHKQPGIEAIDVRVQVRLPQGYVPDASTQGWEAGEASSWVWTARLDRDRDIVLILSPASRVVP